MLYVPCARVGHIGKRPMKSISSPGYHNFLARVSGKTTQNMGGGVYVIYCLTY